MLFWSSYSTERTDEMCSFVDCFRLSVSEPVRRDSIRDILLDRVSLKLNVVEHKELVGRRSKEEGRPACYEGVDGTTILSVGGRSGWDCEGPSYVDSEVGWKRVETSTREQTTSRKLCSIIEPQIVLCYLGGATEVGVEEGHSFRRKRKRKEAKLSFCGRRRSEQKLHQSESTEGCRRDAVAYTVVVGGCDYGSSLPRIILSSIVSVDDWDGVGK